MHIICLTQKKKKNVVNFSTAASTLDHVQLLGASAAVETELSSPLDPAFWPTQILDLDHDKLLKKTRTTEPQETKRWQNVLKCLIIITVSLC